MESLVSFQGPNQRGRRPQGFLAADLLRDSIHHDTHKAFPHILILLSSRTRKDGFLSANGVPWGSIGKLRWHEALILVELNPNMLVRDVERMMIGVELKLWSIPYTQVL